MVGWNTWLLSQKPTKMFQNRRGTQHLDFPGLRQWPALYQVKYDQSGRLWRGCRVGDIGRTKIEEPGGYGRLLRSRAGRRQKLWDEGGYVGGGLCLD